MRSASFKAAAVATIAATALFAGAASASAAGADATHVKKTSKKSKGVSVLLTDFRGGNLAVTVDATGKKSTKHTWALYVDGRKVAAKSYLDKDKSKTWVIKNLPTGDVKLSAPAATGQVTTVALDVK
ncbi:hypothetical protein OG607_32050 [Streptomyces sp. NBC_01537]|uniref:hypothetical protein n=1 Tax=Streptomyces sp. NBC_01537 TaxID=2903896 RepID=UPI00386A53A8